MTHRRPAVQNLIATLDVERVSLSFLENMEDQPIQTQEQKPINKGGNPAWKKGVSGNPNGRPKLSPEQHEMRHASLAKAVEILHNKIHNEAYVNALEPSDLLRMIEIIFDRFGLPKVTKSEHEFDGEVTFKHLIAQAIERSRDDYGRISAN